jgi:hypothetical protein
MKELILALATDGSGVASTNATQAVIGRLYAIYYIPNTIDTGATLTVTVVTPQVTKTLLTKASAGTSNTLYYPRDVMHLATNGAALTGTAGYDLAQPVISGLVNVAIASGAASKAGTVIIYYEE